jgi:arabinose-5-phosphate isomerase
MASPLRALAPPTPFEQLQFAREILRVESAALEQVRTRLDGSFCRAVELLLGARGNVLVTGMGKAGLVGQKIAATLASTGTRAHFLHPAEAVHGDLGRIRSDDALLALSYSGETEEVVRLLPSLARLGVPLVALTSRERSTLARHAEAVISLGPLEEACGLGLAPSTSTTAMLAVGDALALVISRQLGFGREDFAKVHPAGSLGRQLMRVAEIMRSGDALRIAPTDLSVREVFVAASRPGRRTGAIMLVDGEGVLKGLFTDSDLARLFETRPGESLDLPMADVMTCDPTTIGPDRLVGDAVRILEERRISELPVIDEAGRPIGLVDITDVISLMPADHAHRLA